MSISRWNPWGEMMSLRDAMDELLRESIVERRVIGGGQSGSNFGVPVDVRESNDDYVIKAVLPGVKPSDVQVQVKGDTLTISGEMRDDDEGSAGRGSGQGQGQGQGQQQGPQPQQGQQAQQAGAGRTSGQPSQGSQVHGGARHQWLVRERRFGRFQRTLTLPTPVQSDQAQASFEHGILTVTLPKAQEARARSIPIQAGSQAGSQSTRRAIETEGHVQERGQAGSQSGDRSDETGNHASRPGA